MKLFAFEVWFRGWEHEKRVVNHVSLGKAKAARWREIRDLAPADIRFTDLRGRRLGPPESTAALAYVQECRQRPDLVAGARVRVEGMQQEGAIVDAGAGACFVVHFEDGSRLPVHPMEIETIRERAERRDP